MSTSALRDDEATCLAALHALNVLDSEPEETFDALVRACALACGTPISLISLIDTDRQWFKANVGLAGVSQTAREDAFCAHTVLGNELLEVPDATLDARFASNPLVTGEPHIRFYAGVPVQLRDGSRIGTLCVIDREPRQLTPHQREILKQLAIATSRGLERRQNTATVLQFTNDLAVSEARFRSLSESSPLGVYGTNAAGECTYTNPQWRGIYGMTQEQAQGTGWAKTIHPLDRDAVFAAWLDATERQEDFNLAFRILRPDRSVRAVRSRARAVKSPDGTVLGHVGTVEDVTNNKQLEAFLDRTGRIADIGGWEIDMRTHVITWSEQTRRIHEVAADFTPTLDTALDFYNATSRPILLAAVRQGVNEGSSFDLELGMTTARGRPIWVRVQGDVEFENAQAVRMIGAIQDISVQMQHRMALQQEQTLREQLEQHIGQTQRLLHERSEMLDVMAHEVRQPLNNASAALQSAVRVLAGLGEVQAAPRLERAQAVLSQVLGNIDNTLAVAALLARPDPITREYTDINALVDVVIADIPMPLRERIRVQRLTGARTASMDMSLMRLALRNLLFNALKYSEPNSPVELSLCDSDEPLGILIDISNRGPAIAPELQERLFERGIHQGRARAGSNAQGTGLGLYIVRRVMELHGGSARLLSNGPQGVTMRLTVTP